MECWNSYDHAGKKALAAQFGATYDTAKHWVSEGVTDSQTPPQYPNPDTISSPLELRVSRETQTIAVIGDTHNPYQDERAVNLMEELLEEVQPDYLVYNGDVNDFYQVSEFAKDPSRLGRLQLDINSTKDMFTRHKVMLPNTTQILIEGTHEHRWRQFLQKHAPAISGLDCTDLKSLLGLERLGIQQVEFERGLLVNGLFLILHGDTASAHSSYTAKKMSDEHGGSGICNHTHRGGSFYKRDRFGTFGWWENFCLCGLNPDWTQNPNWVQGFSLVHFTAGDRFWVEQIPIIKGKMLYRGKLYE